MTSRYICSSSLTRAAPHCHAHARTRISGRLRRAYADDRSSDSKGFFALVQAGDQAVDVLGHGVEIEARARRRGDAETRHQRLGAVVAGADGDAFPVEDLRDVVRVHTFELEARDAGAPVG